MKLKPFKKRLGDGAWLGVPMNVYQTHPALSSTMLRVLLKSPLTYKWMIDGQIKHEPSAAQQLGTIAHEMLFEDRRHFCLRPETYGPEKKKWNSNAKECAEWEAAHSGKPILTFKEAIQLEQMVSQIRQQPKVTSRKLIEGGNAEVSWIADGEKARTDYIKIDGTAATVVDLKTTTDASDESFRREILRWGYHIQAAWYRRVLKEFGLDLAAWYFLIVQKGALPLVNVLELPKSAMDLGDKEIEKALLLLQQCEANNTWPDFVGDMNEPPDKIQLVDLPAWAYGDADLEGAEEIIP